MKLVNNKNRKFMKKGFLLISILVVSSFALVFNDTISNNRNPLIDLDTDDVISIIISDPTKYYEIVDYNDKERLVETLKSMKLKNKIKNSNDGFAFIITLKLKNKENIYISILSNDVVINKKNHQPEIDYSIKLKDIFNQLSENYKNIPT